MFIYNYNNSKWKIWLIIYFVFFFKDSKFKDVFENY